MKKNFLLFLVFTILVSNQINSQRIDIDKLKFKVVYTDLPARKISPNIQFYTVSLNNSNSVKGYYADHEILNLVNIEGYKRQLENPEAFKIKINIGDFMINKNEITSTTTESKSKDGTVTKTTTYKVSIQYSLSGNYSVADAKGNIMIESSRAGSNYTQSYLSDEFRDYTAASNFSRDNSVSLKTRFIKEEVNKIINDVNYNVTDLYGYGKGVSYQHVWTTDSKRHPENEAFQQMTKDLVANLSLLTYTTMPEDIREKVKPIVAYFEKIAELPNDEKANQKLVFAANYNLASLSYWLDKPKLTKKYGEKIIANDYDKKDGETWIESADKLIKKFELADTNSRHFTREIPGENYVFQSQNNAVVAQQAIAAPQEVVIVRKANPSIIVNKDDSEMEGFIINWSNSDPWDIQRSVKFVAGDKYNEGKYDKKDVQKFDPKEIKAFTYDKKVYIPIYYSDMESGAISLASKWYFAEVAINGKAVKLLNYYDSPPGLSIGSLGEIERQKAALAKKGPALLLLEEGEEKAKNLTTISLEKITEKNPEVMKKYLAGEYSKDKKPVDTKRGLLEKLSARSDMNPNIEYMRIINDLNGNK